MKDFHPFSPPFPVRVLFGDNANFLPYLQAFHTAFVLLAGRDLIPKHDYRVGYFYPTQHVIASLDKNPSRLMRSGNRRFHYFALKHAVDAGYRLSRK